MADTTKYISKINIKGTTYTIKYTNETFAISSINSTVSSLQDTVNKLSTKVTTTQTDIDNLKLSRITASYDSATETLNITEGTQHKG